MKNIHRIITVILLLSLSGLAYSHPPKEKHKNKGGKEKSLPPGLKKKLERGGQLPPGWEKKLVKGQVLEQEIYRHAVRINHRDYPQIPVGIEGTVVVKIDDRLVRLVHATREIIEILN